LYKTAIRMIAKRGYEATTLREIAKEAGVSVGLLYRYFPSKQAVLTALYDDLSQDFARKAQTMKPGKWRDRFLFALRTSLAVLHPHRTALRALIPVLVGDPNDGVFAPATTFSRERVLSVFQNAVSGSDDSPKLSALSALGRVLYLVHLAILLWWLLDRTPAQKATTGLVALTEQILPSAALALRLPPIRKFVVSLDELVQGALFDSPGVS
jgi:AcrR family transcriptional regulator